MASLIEVQKEYVAKIEKLMHLNDELDKLKPSIFFIHKKKLKNIKIKLNEINDYIIRKDIEIMPEFRVTQNRVDGVIIANMISTFYPSRDLLLSNLKKLEQDISSFENEQKYKKSLFIAVIALVVSIITNFPELVEII